MPWDTLIRNGQVVTRDGVRPLDIAIEDGSIVALAGKLSGASREMIDGSGLHIFPGVIDAHVHFNEPGRTEWEGWATGSAALAAGGGTCCFEMPLNAHPPTLDGKTFDAKRVAAEASSRVDFALWGGLTPSNLDTLDELADRGVIGLKAFMSNSGIEDFGRADDETLRRGMAIAARRGLIVAVHAESEEMTSRLTAACRARGGTTWRDYLDTRPIAAEVDAIERAIAIARETGCRLHIVHVSSSAGVHRAIELRKTADVSIETCPHYLLLDEDDLIEQGAPAKCAPPVRPRAEVDKLRADLSAGRIDIIGSDHSPAPPSMKTGDDAFAIWGGIGGVQSTMAGLITLDLPPDHIARLTAANVADRFGVEGKGEIAAGFDADLALIDLGASYTLTREMLHDRFKQSPYISRTFHGAVKRTLVRGQTVFQDGRLVGSSRGRLIRPRGAR